MSDFKERNAKIKADYQEKMAKIKQDTAMRKEKAKNVRSLPKKTKPPGAKWYKSQWLTITTLVLFAPVGIGLTWAYAKWKPVTKVLATIAATIFFIYVLVSSANAAPTLSIDRPEGNGSSRIETEDSTYKLSGKITGANSDTTITVDGKDAQINKDKYSAVVDLDEGNNTIVVVAKKGDKEVSESLEVYRFTEEEVSARRAEEAAKKAEEDAAKQKSQAESDAAKKAAEDKKKADEAAEAKRRADEEAARNAPKTSFGDGTYVVGTEIVPGTYKTMGGGNCYYERLSGLGGTFGEIITNDNPSGQAIVKIASSDAAFSSQGCGTWNKI